MNGKMICSHGVDLPEDQDVKADKDGVKVDPMMGASKVEDHHY